MQSRDELQDAINHLTEDQAREVMGLVRRFLGDSPNGVFERLSTVPGIRMPSRWPPRFKEVLPFKVEGEPASEQLIRERR